jgi:periplasmic protein CpxP/Spy
MNSLKNTQTAVARKACTLLLAAVAATSFAFGAASPVYAGTLPNIDSDMAIHVQTVNMRDLHDQLNLTADQETQWQAALFAMRESHAEAQMHAAELQRDTQTLLQKPILDLSAIHAAHMKAQQQDAQLPEASAKAWLTFYSGLNDQQKKTFSDAMRPSFQNVPNHAARPYDPRTGI